jgi:putative transcriptional regulator
MEPALGRASTVSALPSFADAWPAQLRNRLSSRPLREWRRLPARFRALRVPFSDESSRLWVMRAPGGRGPLRHSHIADEWTVVLEGGFSDETGTYAVDDFAYMGQGDRHRVVAGAREACVCLMLVREHPRYLTVPGKLLAPLLRL